MFCEGFKSPFRGTADVDPPEILRRFTTDLARRGVEVHVPSNPIRDAAFIDLLRPHYVRYQSDPRPAS
jgi:hypothetical protein